MSNKKVSEMSGREVLSRMFDIKILSSLALSIAGSLAFSVVAFASDCGKLIASTGDSQGSFSRTIDQYQRSDGSVYYVYGLRYFGKAISPSLPNYTSFEVHISVNGQTSQFNELIYPASLEGDIVNDACSFGGGNTVESARLFEYAQNGDHLNAWDVSATVNGKTETARFEQVSFDHLFPASVAK